jgi:hypothetical protein
LFLLTVTQSGKSQNGSSNQRVEFHGWFVKRERECVCVCVVSEEREGLKKVSFYRRCMKGSTEEDMITVNRQLQEQRVKCFLDMFRIHSTGLVPRQTISSRTILDRPLRSRRRLK